MRGHAAALSAAVDAIASAYSIVGQDPAPAVAITHDGSTYQLPMSSAQASTEMKPLLDAARDSGFGKGMGKGSTTEQDTSVRVAKELSAEEIEVSGIEMGPILEQVRQALVPEAAGVRAELYKLNIMMAGGFFKPHKDTPRGGPTCFGSLVVCLPVPFQGGELKLKHGSDDPEEVDFAEKINGANHWWTEERLAQMVPKDVGIQWVAFFGDVEHEVQKVEAGMRLTLTYTLHREEAAQGSSSSTANPLLLRAGQLHDALAAALGDKKFMKDGGTLGYYCRHLYEESSIAQVEGVLGCEGRGAYASKLALKNEDAVVAAVLAAAGLEVQVLRLLQAEDLDDRVLRRMPTEQDRAKVIQPTLVEDCEWADGTTLEDVMKIARHTLEEVAGGEVQWLGNHDLAAKLWAETYYTNTGWFGNEASEVDFYTGAALIAKVPKATLRGAIAAAARQPLTAQQVGAVGGATSRAAGARASQGAAAAGSSRGKSPAAGAAIGSKRGAADTEDSQPKRSRSAAAGTPGPAAAAAGPATLSFVKPAPGVQPRAPVSEANSKQRKAAAAAGPGMRTIHIEGGKGDTAGDGRVTMILDGEADLREVRTFLRQRFGAYSGKRMGAIMLLDPKGKVLKEAKGKDLVHGVRLQVTYVDSKQGYWTTTRGGKLVYKRGPQPASRGKAAKKKPARSQKVWMDARDPGWW